MKGKEKYTYHLPLFPIPREILDDLDIVKVMQAMAQTVRRVKGLFGYIKVIFVLKPCSASKKHLIAETSMHFFMSGGHG